MKKNREKIEWLEMVIPKKHLERFEVEEIIKTEKEIQVKLREGKAKKPQPKNNKRLVLNGYDKSTEILTGSLNGRAVFVRYICRKWISPESGTTYRNQYEIHPEGCKLSHEFAAYLKKISRREAVALFDDWRSVRHLREEDLPVVPRRAQWLQRFRRTRETP